MTTGVLGLGLIGGSLLQGLAAAGAEPVGADADPAVAGAARAEGFHVVADAAALAAACDVVVVCVPPNSTAAAVTELLAASPDVVVADTASVKAPIVRSVAADSPRAGTPASAQPSSARPPAPRHADRFVGAHPLAGAEHAGWAAAAPERLRDAVWAVCPPALDAPLDALCALAAALDPLAPRLVACSADAHDAAVGRTSHVPHMAAQALARLPSAAGLPLAAALSGGSYRDMTRTVQAEAALWLDIVRANRGETTAGLRELVADLERLANAVESGDDDALRDAWHAGAAARATVDAVRWTAPAWRPHRIPATWSALLDLGRAGVPFRRPRLTGGALELETGGAAA